MTIEELEAAVVELQGVVATQAIEIQRTKDMLQTLSESKDQDRRELQFAAARAETLTARLNHDVAQAGALIADAATLKAEVAELKRK